MHSIFCQAFSVLTVFRENHNYFKNSQLLQERRALPDRRVLPEADGRSAEPPHPRQPDAGRARD